MRQSKLFISAFIFLVSTATSLVRLSTRACGSCKRTYSSKDRRQLLSLATSSHLILGERRKVENFLYLCMNRGVHVSFLEKDVHFLPRERDEMRASGKKCVD